MMLINNWYVAAYSSEVVTDKPLGVKMLGCDFVLFRNAANKAVCLSDVCCHRGASLSRGKIVGDGCAVACPFHGWEFESNGICSRIPSMGNDKLPTRARVDSYPTYERYDWVWVFLGDLPDDKRPPVPDMLPEFSQTDKWRSTHLKTEVPVNWTKMEENPLDAAHLTFVHDLCHRIHREFRPGVSQIAYSTTTPIDQYNSRLFTLQARNYVLEADHDQARLDGRKAAFRSIVTQMIEKGWEIDVRKVAEDYDRKVYVIPSPDRRRDPGNWVHEAIPTTRPRTEDDEFVLI